MVWIVRTQSETDELKTHLPMEYLEDGQERVAAMEKAIIDDLIARFRGENHEPYSSPDWDIALVRDDIDPARAMPLYTGHRFPQIDRPLKYRITEVLGKRRLPDIIGQLVFVPDEVRDIIESIEPDWHVFWPVEFYLSDGERVKRRYWRLCAVGRRDTLAVEKSNVFVRSFGEGAREYSRVSSRNNVVPDFVKFSNEKVAGHTVWYEFRLNHGEKVISDKFAKDLVECDLSGLYFNDYEHYEEVDADFASPHKPKYIRPTIIHKA